MLKLRTLCLVLELMLLNQLGYQEFHNANSRNFTSFLVEDDDSLVVLIILGLMKQIRSMAYEGFSFFSYRILNIEPIKLRNIDSVFCVKLFLDSLHCPSVLYIFSTKLE